MSRLYERAARALPGFAGLLFVLALVGLVVVDGDEEARRVEDYARGQGGTLYTATDGGFQGAFPTSPERRTKRVDAMGSTVEVVDYTSGSDDYAFTMSFADVAASQEVGDPIVRLNASATGAAAAVKGKLVSSRITTLVGLPAVEYLISTGDTFVKATSAMSGRRLYGIQVVGERDPPTGYDRFRASFRLTT
jgi:hypothetical protein